MVGCRRPATKSAVVALGLVCQPTAAARLPGSKAAKSRRLQRSGPAVRVKPTFSKAHLALAMIFQQKGADAKAVQQYRDLLLHKPNDPMATNNLAWLLATSRDQSTRNPREAVTLAEKVARQSNRLPSVLDTLAAAYAAAGRYPEAVATAREAIARLSKTDAVAADKIRERLRLYTQEKSLP